VKAKRGKFETGPSVKEGRGNLRQRAICEGGDGKFETAGHL